MLRPASTIKTNIKERLKREREEAEKKGTLENYNRFIKTLKKEHKGRIPLGEKGVGRFATHRLGKNLLIKTKTKEIDYELLLEINWDDFDIISNESIDLDSIGVKLTKQPISRDYGERNSGTQLIIYGSREGFELNKTEIKEINESINKLNTPFPNPSSKDKGFSIYFECPQFTVLKTKPILGSFEPVFTIDGIVDEWGIFEYDYKFTPPNTVTLPIQKEELKNQEIDLKKGKENKKYWQNPDNPRQYRKPCCGSFFFHIEIWYRSSPWIVGPDAKSFTKYLDEYGGISVYRDGINIFPAEWGAETDWLKLSKRHIKRGTKMSYYNFIGNIEIEQEKNINLIDKTNREGLVQNRAANDLTELTRAIILHLENNFIGKRDEFQKLSGIFIRQPKTFEQYIKKSANIIDNIYKADYDLEDDSFNFFAGIFEKDKRKEKLIDLSRSLKNVEGSLKVMQDVQNLLSENAGFGISIAVAIHELNKTTAQFYYGISELIKKGKLDKNKLKFLQDSSLSLQSELKRLSPLRAIRNKERSEFGIQDSIKFSSEVYKRRFKELNINFTKNNEDFNLFSRYEAINQIITNLFDNSCFWLDDPNFDNREISIKVDSIKRTIIIADNGPNIHESILPYLFEPGYSLKVPPSGLGLYICKYYMKSEKGDIYLTPQKNRIEHLVGAQFTLDFSHTPKTNE